MKINRKVMVICVGVIVLLFTFVFRFQSLTMTFKAEAVLKEKQIQQYNALSKVFIEMVSTYGQSYYKEKAHEPALLMKYVKFDPSQTYFHMDGLAGSIHESDSGNITGNPEVLDTAVGLQDLDLAMRYNDFFKTFSTQLKEVAWLYYTTESGLINLFPFVPSKEFHYDQGTKSVAFYQVATPVKNPNRLPVWTPVYEDTAGKGLMVTLSKPVYDSEKFRGVVSIDFTNQHLTDIADSPYEGYLVDHTGFLIASSGVKVEQSGIIAINELIKSKGFTLREVNKLEKQKLTLLGQHLVYVADINNDSWQMFYMFPIRDIIMYSLLSCVPVLIICILFYYAVKEIDGRRRMEKELELSVKNLQSSQELLKNAANHDFLTDTFNRRGFITQFEEAINQQKQESEPLIMVLTDLDSFKAFNDSFGQLSGDRMLVEVTKTLKSYLVPTDLLSRWAGGSFIILLRGRTLDEAEELCHAMKNAVDLLKLDYQEHQKLHVTLSFGICVHENNDPLENTLMKAELALHEGKLNGKNRVVVFRGFKG